MLRFHEFDEHVQRMLNAVEPGSYVRPHRHVNPVKPEAFVVLRGSVLVVRFARLERAYWTEIFYYFEPHEFSGGSLAQQAQAAAQWAEELAPVVRAGLEIRGP